MPGHQSAINHLAIVNDHILPEMGALFQFGAWQAQECLELALPLVLRSWRNHYYLGSWGVGEAVSWVAMTVPLFEPRSTVFNPILL